MDSPDDAGSFSFDEDFQTKIAALLARDSKFAARVDGLVKPDYFTQVGNAAIVDIVLNYYELYRTIPSSKIFIKLFTDRVAKGTFRSDLVPTIKQAAQAIWKMDLLDADYVVDQVVQFARHQAVSSAILKSATILEKGEFAKIEALMREALSVGANDTVREIDYWRDIEKRTQQRKDELAGIAPITGITTGYRALDNVLKRKGWGKQELSIIMGGAKSGKSIGLIDFAKNGSLAKYNTLFVSLELADDIVTDRTDANISSIPILELNENIITVEQRIKQSGQNGGELRILRMPAYEFSPNDMRRLLARYRSRGLMFELLVIDYLDIMAPNHWTKEPTENSKSVWLGMRNIAIEEDLAVLSATQSNRDGMKAGVAGMIHASDDINKVRICDLLISINRTEEEKIRNEARLFFAASRNQRGDFSIKIKQDIDRMKFITEILGME